MWDKIVAGIVAILLIGLAVGAMVPSGSGGEGDHGGVTSLALVVENVDNGTSQTLTLEVPGTISLTKDFFQTTGILDNPSAFTTVTDPDNTWSKDDTIKVHAVADVWWSSDNIDSVNRISYKQTAGRETTEFSLEPKANPWISNNGNKIIETEVTSGINLDRSQDNPRSFAPGDEYFVEQDNGTPLIADDVDESGIEAEIVIEGTDVNGNTVSDTISLAATISLDFKDDGSFSLGAELTEAETVSQ